MTEKKKIRQFRLSLWIILENYTFTAVQKILILSKQAKKP